MNLNSFLRLFIFSFNVIIFGCSHTNKSTTKSIAPSQINLDEWTLESSPNNLDVVGVIIGVDKKGTQVRIPGGKILFNTTSSPVMLTEQKVKKSFGAFARFTKINSENDPLLNFDDSIKLDLLFSIKNGILTNINDDIATGFARQKKIIESNLAALDLDSLKLFLILETIQSPNVHMVFTKSNSNRIGLFDKIKKIAGFNSQISYEANRTNELNYDLGEPLVVFYKLRQINVNVSSIKGQQLKKIYLSLGEYASF